MVHTVRQLDHFDAVFSHDATHTLGKQSLYVFHDVVKGEAEPEHFEGVQELFWLALLLPKRGHIKKDTRRHVVTCLF